jgi:guanyl-specific ribonuclease Sa
MSSRNRSIAVAVLVLCAIVAAAVYALDDRGGPQRGATAVPATPPGSGAASGPASRLPSGRASAPRSGPTVPASAGRTGWVPNDPSLADVCRSRLPSQARDTLVLIADGGPYPYRSDGVVFENREGRLPRHPGGYYHEYTVVTPGSADRGTRRVVTGQAGERFWTADHYGSFQEIDARC